MNNPFDDLVPDQKISSRGNPFDDLIADKPVESVAPSNQIPDFGDQNAAFVIPLTDFGNNSRPPERLYRKNAPPILQDLWNQIGAPPTVGPLREIPLRPDVREAQTLTDFAKFFLTGRSGPGLALPNEPTGLIENAGVGLKIGAAHVASNLLSWVYSGWANSIFPSEEDERPRLYARPTIGVLEPEGQESKGLPSREETYNALYQMMTRSLNVNNLAPPQDFSDALAQGAGESVVPLIETILLSQGAGAAINPAFEGLATKFPTLAAKAAPIVRDGLALATQGALEPDQPGMQAATGASAGTVLGALSPYGRPVRVLVGAALGAAQQYATNPNATIQDYARNATLMAAFGGLAAAHGMTLQDTIAGTLFDWARDKGYTPEEFARTLQINGLQPIANEFAEDMSSGTPTTPQSLTDQLAGKFKPAMPDEFIAERDKSEKRPFLTPYTAGDMKDWQSYLTDEKAGFALKPDGDIIGVFNNSGRRGAGEEAVALAIAKGGKTLDCVEGFLDRYYNSFGFVEKSGVPWDDNQAPKGWDYETYGRRPIIYFEFPEDFSRDPVDTARRLELARSEGGPWRTGVLWDHDRWVAELAKIHGEGLDNQTPKGPGGGAEYGGESLGQPSETSEKPSEEQ